MDTIDRRSMKNAIDRVEALHPGSQVEVEFREGRPYAYKLVVAKIHADPNEGDYGDWIDHVHALADGLEAAASERDR